MKYDILRPAFVALCLVLVAAVPGCRHRTAAVAADADTARETLRTALTAWQNGQAGPGAIPNTTPAVQAVDSRWASGQRLQSFEILQEEPGDGGGVEALFN